MSYLSDPFGYPDRAPGALTALRRWALPAGLTVLLLASLTQGFLAFHVIAELFACVVGIVLFVVSTATWRLTRNTFFLWLGCGYFWVSVIDILHTLAYKGMHVLEDATADTATQLWLVARLLQALVLLAAPLFLGHRLRPGAAFLGLGALAIGGMVGALGGVFPAAYVEGIGLTPWKVGVEYGVITILVAAGGFLWLRRRMLDGVVYRLLTGAITLTVISELAFTLYVGVYDAANVAGHVLKFLAFWMVFDAVVRTVLEEPFRALARDAGTYDAVPDPTLLVDRTGIIVQANRAATEHFDRSRAALVGAPAHDLLHPDQGSAAGCGPCGAVFGSGEAAEEESYNVLSGRHYHATFTPMADGMVVVLRDVTARKRAEDWVRTHAERLAMAMENGEQGLWDWNIATGTVYFSPAMETMLGYDAGAWEPHVASWETLVHPDDMAHVMAVLTAHLEGRSPLYETEHRVRRADGTWAWILDKGKVVERDADGRPLRAVGTHTDITLLKRQEDVLREQSRRLAESNRDLEQFAYAASHDLQEPLRMVAGYLTLLRRRHGEALTEEAREFLGFAVDGASRMSRMISDLLDFSRVSTRAAEPRPVALEVAAGRALESLGLAVTDAGATVTVAPDMPEVMGDPAQLERVFQNLIANALKYRDPERPPQVRVSAEPAAPGFVRVLVADNGIGIDPADFDRIFQVFTRLHGRMETEGTGIGLAIVKRVVERHGGTIDVVSAFGQGSTFRFTLPLPATAGRRKGHRPPAETATV